MRHLKAHWLKYTLGGAVALIVVLTLIARFGWRQSWAFWTVLTQRAPQIAA